MQFITISGNVVRKPVLRHTPAGVPVTTVTVAINKRFTNSKGNREEQTTYFDVEFWRDRAINHARWLDVGRAVVITGEMKNPRPWVGEDNIIRCTLEVDGNTCEYIGKGTVDKATVPAVKAPVTRPVAPVIATTTIEEVEEVEVPQFEGVVDPETGEILSENEIDQEPATPFS